MDTTARLALGATAGLAAAAAFWLTPLTSLTPEASVMVADAPPPSPTSEADVVVPASSEPEHGAQPPTFARIEVAIGAHLSTAFSQSTRIGKHLRALDEALIGRLDLYSHARPGTALTLWENEAQQLVAAAVPLRDGTKLLAARYNDGDKDGWYNARGQSLEGLIEGRPVPLSLVTSSFGARLHPISGRRQKHLGVDYGAAAGTPIRAVADGRVRRLMMTAGTGLAIEVTHAGNYISRYFHMRGLAPRLGEGSRVKAGQKIGFVGASGRTTGPHLHYELRLAGEPLDAAALLPASREALGPEDLASHRDFLRRLTTMPAPTR